MFENVNDYILQPIINAAIPFIFSIISVVITKNFQQKKGKSKRDIWIKLLNSDRYINECVQQYKKIEIPKDRWMAIAAIMGAFLGSLYYFFFLIVTIYVFNIFNFMNSWSPVYSTFIAFFSSFILTIVLKFQIGKRNKDKTLLNESGRNRSVILFVNWFIFYSLLANLFFLAIAVAQTKNFDIIINDIIVNKNLYAFSVLSLIVAIVLSKKNQRDFLNYSKILCILFKLNGKKKNIIFGIFGNISSLFFD